MTLTCKQRQPDTLAYIDSYCFQCSESRLFSRILHSVLTKRRTEALVSWYFLGWEFLSTMNHQNAFKTFQLVTSFLEVGGKQHLSRLSQLDTACATLGRIKPSLILSRNYCLSLPTLTPTYTTQRKWKIEVGSTGEEYWHITSDSTTHTHTHLVNEMSQAQ